MTSASSITEFPSYGGVERRTRNRYKVEIYCRAGDSDLMYPARITELSRKGAFLECELSAPRGTELRLEIDPGIQVLATVKQSGWFLVDHRKGFYLGVEFSPGTLQAVDRLVQAYPLDTPAPVKYQFI